MHRGRRQPTRYDLRSPLAAVQVKLCEHQGELRPGAKEGL